MPVIKCEYAAGSSPSIASPQGAWHRGHCTAVRKHLPCMSELVARAADPPRHHHTRNCVRAQQGQPGRLQCHRVCCFMLPCAALCCARDGMALPFIRAVDGFGLGLGSVGLCHVGLRERVIGAHEHLPRPISCVMPVVCMPARTPAGMCECMRVRGCRVASPGTLWWRGGASFPGACRGAPWSTTAGIACASRPTGCWPPRRCPAATVCRSDRPPAQAPGRAIIIAPEV
jgi:hypothetical protein